MKKVLISQPIEDVSFDDFFTLQQEVSKKLEKREYLPVETIFIQDNLHYLSQVFSLMKNCDAIYFASGWTKSKVCRIIRLTAVLYKIEIVDDTENKEVSNENIN